MLGGDNSVLSKSRFAPLPTVSVTPGNPASVRDGDIEFSSTELRVRVSKAFSCISLIKPKTVTAFGSSSVP
ncbi:MAG: hypothetical protein BRC49_11940 [Cyanobacteria bacterium SW_10_48_33]|nr:MAG: hypothetical protein BRC43_10810 [Cyanobacteria bacterium QS_3_48_167]PSP09798.1 MAG: hypothetical protein BRC49_11940 [Cyanobacteria bacterium SW_10_48_33]